MKDPDLIFVLRTGAADEVRSLEANRGDLRLRAFIDADGDAKIAFFAPFKELDFNEWIALFAVFRFDFADRHLVGRGVHRLARSQPGDLDQLVVAQFPVAEELDFSDSRTFEHFDDDDDAFRRVDAIDLCIVKELRAIEAAGVGLGCLLVERSSLVGVQVRQDAFFGDLLVADDLNVGDDRIVCRCGRSRQTSRRFTFSES